MLQECDLFRPWGELGCRIPPSLGVCILWSVSIQRSLRAHAVWFCWPQGLAYSECLFVEGIRVNIGPTQAPGADGLPETAAIAS